MVAKVSESINNKEIKRTRLFSLIGLTSMFVLFPTVNAMNPDPAQDYSAEQHAAQAPEKELVFFITDFCSSCGKKFEYMMPVAQLSVTSIVTLEGCPCNNEKSIPDAPKRLTKVIVPDFCLDCNKTHKFAVLNLDGEEILRSSCNRISLSPKLIKPAVCICNAEKSLDEGDKSDDEAAATAATPDRPVVDPELPLDDRLPKAKRLKQD